MTALAAREVAKRYGQTEALRGVSLEVGEGELVGLLARTEPGSPPCTSVSGSVGGAVERRELLELVGLADATRTRVEAMSKGMQQRLGIAQALVGGPRVLLLDDRRARSIPWGAGLSASPSSGFASAGSRCC